MPCNQKVVVKKGSEKYNSPDRSGGRLQGSCGVFLGALSYYLCTFLICINKIMSFITDDWTNFIVFVLPEEVKVYTFLGKKRVSENL